MQTPEQVRLTRGPSDVGPKPDRGVSWSRKATVFVVVSGLVGVLVGGGAVWLWQDAQGQDESAATSQAIAERDDALADVATLSAQVDELEAELAAAIGDVEVAQQELADAQARLDAMLGPALPDGRHIGYLVAVGAAQEPPRLVIDVVQWFTDEAANQAAAEDGALAPDQTQVENGYYIRNENPQWRILEIDPAATVALTVYPYGDPSAPRDVSLARFGEIFGEDAPLASLPYWITMRDGIVTGIEQQFIP
jgi:outer membrane murein-binding lipoprotein Lpp